MSCYLTDAETIGMIARWAADNCGTFRNMIKHVAGRMMAEDLVSVENRQWT